MIVKKDYYTSLPIAKQLIWVAPNYISSVYDCASEGGWSSIWTLLALADVIGVPIQSIYPPLNGEQDFSYKMLNLTAKPRNCVDVNKVVTVMWTRTTQHNPRQMWIPNHFVPIVQHSCVTHSHSFFYDSEEFPPLTRSTSPTLDCTNFSPSPVLPPLPSTPKQSDTNLDHNSSSTPCDIPMESDHEQDSVLAPPYASIPLPSSQTLSASQVFDAVIGQSYPTVKSIPDGYKDNVFFLLDNSVNKNSLKTTFVDDCGSWDTHSGRTTKEHFIVMPDNKLKWTIKKDDLFHFQTKKSGKKFYTPYSPQPENVVTLHRYYATLKRDKLYKKRVSWFESIPEVYVQHNHFAVVEYIGVSPRHGQPHGNAKNSSQDYIRTKPEIIDQIKTGISQKKSNFDIYKDMVLTNPDDAPRDKHQIRNVKYNEKKKSTQGASGNVADEIIEVLSMVNTDEFVQEVVYTQGNNKPPSVICYTKEQMQDLQHFLKTDSDRILGIDRTFNLGAVYVTNIVYKNVKVTSKETGDHPIFVGPMFLHWEGSFLSYHTFLSHVKARIQEGVNCIDLRMGSDDEPGLTKAIDSVFPNISRLLCTKHIKDNVSDHLKNKIGCTDDKRAEILSKIFGANGLSAAEEKPEFDIKARDICTEYPEFSHYFQHHLQQRLRDHVNVPLRQLKHDRLWTNNNCESINHVFKRAINWTPQSIPELTRSLHDIVKLQFIEVRRSLYCTGNFELFGVFRKHACTYQVWKSKSEDQREKIYEKLLTDYNYKNEKVQSSYKNFEVPRAKRLAAKPYQTKRPRTSRTQKRF